MSRIKTKFYEANSVTNPKLAQMANNTVKGNKSGGSADPSDLVLSDVAEATSSVLTITNGTKAVAASSNLTIKVNLDNGKLYVGNASNVPVGVSLSGDATLSNVGVLTLSNGISHTSFSAANNQSSAADVTGLAFANGSVRSFEALVSVYVNATASLYEQFKLYGIQNGTGWYFTSHSLGDTSGFVFTITSAGQVQYTSTNNAGFVAATVKFRAITTAV